eukprot:TRINITY_DN46991_c0_g1_i1.p1 TRINITY_DN46991_c0_g1~~TRINITY_DN46991_c0_g1_i1.p1  ORF type:complete len:494 (+),score=96.20 TRINITY_DN46991_c0_g1_i1:49-1530(+)
MDPPPIVQVHTEFEKGFGAYQREIHLCWVVQEVSRAGDRQKRVLLVSRQFLFVCELDGKVSRVRRLTDLGDVVVHRPTAAPTDEVLFGTTAAAEETDHILIVLRADRRNVPVGFDSETLLRIVNGARGAALVRVGREPSELSVERLAGSAGPLRSRANLSDKRFEDVPAKMSRWQSQSAHPAVANPYGTESPRAAEPSMDRSPRAGSRAGAETWRSAGAPGSFYRGDEQGGQSVAPSAPRPMVSAIPDVGAASVDLEIAGKPAGVPLGIDLKPVSMALQGVRVGAAQDAGLARLLGWRLAAVDGVPVTHPVAAAAVSKEATDPVLTFLPPRARGAPDSPPEPSVAATLRPLQYSTRADLREATELSPSTGPFMPASARPSQPSQAPMVRPLPGGRWAGPGVPPPQLTSQPAPSGGPWSSPTPVRVPLSSGRPASLLWPGDPVWDDQEKRQLVRDHQIAKSRIRSVSPPRKPVSRSEFEGRVVIRCQVPFGVAG